MKTYKELVSIQKIVLNTYGKVESPEDIATKKLHKLQKWNEALNNKLTIVQEKANKAFMSGKNDIDVDCATEIDVEVNGKMVKQLARTKEGYVYSKEGEKQKYKLLTELSDSINKEADETEIDISDLEPFMLTAEELEEINTFLIEKFEGILIKK